MKRLLYLQFWLYYWSVTSWTFWLEEQHHVVSVRHGAVVIATFIFTGFGFNLTCRGVNGRRSGWPFCPRGSAGPSACSCSPSSTPSPGCWSTPAGGWPCAAGWRCASSCREAQTFNADKHFRHGANRGNGYLLLSLRLLSTQPEEEVVDEGRDLVADQDPVLVDQVVGGDVGVGSAERLLQRVPLKGRHYMVLCQETKTHKTINQLLKSTNLVMD